ncbi:MAG: hypothetical protein QXH42_09750 [Thermoplasmata archaeon]
MSPEAWTEYQDKRPHAQSPRDCDTPALSEGGHTLKFSDINVSQERAMLNGTGPLDGDTPLSNLSCAPTTPQYGLSETMYTDFFTIDAEVYGVSGSLEIAGREVRTIPEVIGEEVGDWAVFSSSVIACTDFYGVNYCFEYTNRSNPLRSDIDRNFILDRWEARSELTQIDGKPPEILKVDGNNIMIEFVSVYSDTFIGKIQTGLKIRVTVTARDGAGLDRFEISISGQGKKVFRVADGSMVAEASVEFGFDGWRALTKGWDLEVIVYDRNNNGNRTNKHIDGVFEGAVKALISIFNALVEAVKELASKSFDWIWTMIQKLINRGIELLKKLIINNFIKLISKLLLYYSFYINNLIAIKLNYLKIINFIGQYSLYDVIINSLIMINPIVLIYKNIFGIISIQSIISYIISNLLTLIRFGLLFINTINIINIIKSKFSNKD